MLQRQAVHVRDEIVGASGDVRWGMVTAAEIKLEGHKAVLRQDGKTLLAEILSPADAAFEILSNQPPTKQEWQNAGTYILATRLTAEADKRVEISVVLQPLEKGDKSMTVQLQPLRDWQRR